MKQDQLAKKAFLATFLSAAPANADMPPVDYDLGLTSYTKFMEYVGSDHVARVIYTTKGYSTF